MLIPRAAVYFEIISQLVVNGEPIALSLSVKVNIDAQLDEVWVTSWDVCEVGKPTLNTGDSFHGLGSRTEYKGDSWMGHSSVGRV